MKKKNGFSLLELMVVLVLMAIAGAIAIPGFTRWLPNYRLRSAASDLYSNMQLAKAGAARDRADWAIHFDTNNNRYRLLSDDGGDGDWKDGDETVEKTVELGDYGSGVTYGHGTATDDIPGNGSAPTDDITYGSDLAVFNMRGTCNAGYVYLDNIRDSTFGVGSRSCGAILSRRWDGSSWE